MILRRDIDHFDARGGAQAATAGPTPRRSSFDIFSWY